LIRVLGRKHMKGGTIAEKDSSRVLVCGPRNTKSRE
jgi:hypothetical protein